MRQIFVIVAITAVCGMALAVDPLIRVDFNDVDGNASLVNRGSVSVTGAFEGGATNSAIAAPINEGGYSGDFNHGNQSKVSLGNLSETEALASFTISAWVYLQDTPTATDHLVGDYTHPSGFLLSIDTNRKLTTRIDGTPATSASAVVPLNSWIFVALTYDGTLTENNVTFYTGTTPDNLTQQGVSSINNGTTGTTLGDLYLGGYSSANTEFHGLMDNVRIYGSQADASGVLVPSQLRAVMHEADLGSGNVDSGPVIADFNDLTLGVLDGQAGGSGMLGDYTSGGSYDVIAGDLTYPLYNLSQTGTAHSVQALLQSGGNGQASRALTDGLEGTIWVSLLGRTEDIRGRWGFGCNPDFLSNNATSNAFNMLIFNNNTETNTLMLRQGGTVLESITTAASTTGTVNLALMRIQIDAEGDNEAIDFWFNPDVSAYTNEAEFTSAVVPSLSYSSADLLIDVTGISLISYGSTPTYNGGVVDNFRMSGAADAFWQVTGVGSPGGGETPDPAVLFIAPATGGITISSSNLTITAMNTLQSKTVLTDSVWSNLYMATGVTATNWTVPLSDKSFFRTETTY